MAGLNLVLQVGFDLGLLWNISFVKRQKFQERFRNGKDFFSKGVEESEESIKVKL